MLVIQGGSVESHFYPPEQGSGFDRLRLPQNDRNGAIRRRLKINQSFTLSNILRHFRETTLSSQLVLTPFERLIDSHQNLLFFKRLGNIIKRLMAHGLYSRLNGSVGGDKNQW